MTEETYADVAGDAEKVGQYTAEMGRDIVKGWNDRRNSSNIEISSLTPFVQLIGLFPQLEIEKMFSFDITSAKRKVYFDDGTEPTSLGAPEPPAAETDAYKDIKEQLDKRSINIYFSGSTNPEGRGAPIPGIVLAETRTQADPGNYKGGVGISDLQIDYGKSSAVGSRTYKMRLTVNDPQIINEQVEYSKLATMNGEFVILYGWTNPTVINGFNALPVPVEEEDPTSDKKKMVIPLNGAGTGGYWQAARMSILAYDFSFNEMGQIEIAVSFLDKTSLALASQKVGPIASDMKKIFATEEYSSQAKEAGNVDTPSEGFGSTMVTIGGVTKSYADWIADGQKENKMAVFEHAMAAGGYTPDDAGMDRLLSNVESQDLGSLAAFFQLDVEDMFSGVEQASLAENEKQNIGAFISRDKEKQLKKFPYAGTGIRVYEQVMKSVSMGSDEFNEATGEPVMEEIPAYNIKTTHYYFGWILEAMKLGMQNANKHKIRMGETPAIPNFTYLDNPDADQITNVFQAKQAARQHGPMSQRIQDAIIRLKEKCIPPFRARMPADDVVDRVGGKPGNAQGNPINFETSPCKNKIVIENIHELTNNTNTTATQLLDQIKANVGLTDADIEAMEQPDIDGVSFRGHLIETIVTITPRRGHSWLGPADTPVPVPITVRSFIPDTNFDPSNPTDYDIQKSRLYDPNILGGLEALVDRDQRRLVSLDTSLDGTTLESRRNFTDTELADHTGEEQKLRQRLRAVDAAVNVGEDPIGLYEDEILSASAARARRLGYVGGSIAGSRSKDEEVVRGRFFFFLRCEWRKQPETGGIGFGAGIGGGVAAIAVGGGLSPVGLVAGGLASAAYKEYWRTGQLVGRYKLMAPDEARMYVNWELIQRKWYNIHVKAMTSHFEALIYKRMDELEAEGRAVEEIYNEPVDLDWITSLNHSWNALIDPQEQIASYEDIKSSSWLRGHNIPEATEPILKRIDEYDKDIEDLRIARDEVGTRLRNKLNFMERQKESIERKTGGRFDRTLDFEENTRRGNDFYNFNKVINVMAELNERQQESADDGTLLTQPATAENQPVLTDEDPRPGIPIKGESPLLSPPAADESDEVVYPTPEIPYSPVPLDDQLDFAEELARREAELIS